MKSFRELKVWQKAHGLVLDLYKITKTFPSDERFGIVSQLRRAASSIPSNIVEGFKRRTKKDFAHFVNMAESSLEETKYGLLLSFDLGYLKKRDFDSLSEKCDEIGRMLNGLYKRLNP
ncbi:MAG: four helix bundle protein [Planctomycetota bacterium]